MKCPNCEGKLGLGRKGKYCSTECRDASEKVSWTKWLILATIAIGLVFIARSAKSQEMLIELPVLTVICNTQDQIDMYVDLRHNDQEESSIILSLEVNKHFGVKNACGVIDMPLPAFYVGEVDSYQKGDVKVVIHNALVFFDNNTVVSQFFFEVINDGLSI